MATPRYALIACEILFRELSQCAAHSSALVDPVFLPKGLHDQGEQKMAARLQLEINRLDPDRYQAILLGYALCNNGIRGLQAPRPLVVPRAHDCISLLLGSRGAYNQSMAERPGTYFLSPGWCERDTGALGADSILTQLGMNRSWEDLVAEYGEENAAYIRDTLTSCQHYTTLGFIDTGVGPRDRYRQQAQAEATRRGWELRDLPGDTGWLQRLCDGDWNQDEFQVCPPGQTIVPTHDARVICSGPCKLN